MLHKHIQAIILLCFISLSVFGQNKDSCNAVLFGSVTDLNTKEKLGYASIFIKEAPGKSTQTDEKGQYKISGLCPGSYTLVCSHLNCERITVSVMVSGVTSYDIRMPHHEHEGALIVISDKSERPPVTQARNDISGRMLENSRGQSLGKIASQVSGVTELQTGSGISKPMIHGMHSNRLVMLHNGVRLESQQWGLEHAPEIDPFTASRITIIKGASAVRYGSDAIGGLILIDPEQLRDSSGIDGIVHLVGFSNNREGNVSATLNHAPARLKGFSYRVQGTMKRGGNYRTPDYWLKNTASAERNFSLAAGYTHRRFESELFYSQFNTDIGIFSGSHIGNITDLYRAFESPVPLDSSGFSYEIGRPFQHVEHELMKFRTRVFLNETWKLHVMYARQYNLRNEFDKHRPLNDSLAALNKPELHYEITTHSGEAAIEHNMLHRFSGSAGISGSYQFNTYEGRFFIPNFRSYTFGGWILERWYGDSIVTIEAGLRYENRFLQSYMWENNVIISPVRTFENLAATAGAIFRLNERLQFNANIGKSWRAPTVNELYSNGLHHGAAAVEIGDKNLNMEKGISSMFTGHWHDHEKLEIEVTMYYNHFSNFIYLMPVMPPTVTIRGTFPTFIYSQTTAVIYGSDLNSVIHFSENFEGRIGAALVRAKNLKTNEWLVMMPADRCNASLTYNWKDRKRFSDLYTTVSGIYVNRQFRVPYNSDFVAPPSAYYLLGAEAGIKLHAGKQSIQLGISVNNMLNRKYREYLNRFRYYADETGRNIRIHISIPFNYSIQKK